MDTAWVLWAGSGLVSFGVLEGIAVYAGRDEWTLSSVARRHLGVRPPRRWGLPASVALGAGAALLVVHICAEWP